MPNDYPFTEEEFWAIYSKVPRLTVEIIVKNSESEIVLTKRAIEPCAGQWHLPGGTVYFGESVNNAVKRVAKKELGINVVSARPNGFIEYPSHYLNGLDTPVGLVFEVIEFEGDIVKDVEASDTGWFKKLPSPMHADQDEYLLNNGYFES